MSGEPKYPPIHTEIVHIKDWHWNSPDGVRLVPVSREWVLWRYGPRRTTPAYKRNARRYGR